MNNQSIHHMTDIFGNTIVLSNKLQKLVDRELSPYHLTAKQWLLLACLGRFFEEPPNLKELANAMGSSYQNVKQLALKLEKSGFVKLLRDPSDRRTIRIHSTEHNQTFWAEYQSESLMILQTLFNGLDETEIATLSTLLAKWVGQLAKEQGGEDASPIL